MSDATRILKAVERGEPHAAEELLPLVYDELRRLAAAKMANEKPGQTLQPTALVHEAWLQKIGEGGMGVVYSGTGSLDSRKWTLNQAGTALLGDGTRAG